jgi:hypothetical protein
MSYTNVFGGYNINTAFPSYINYTIGADLQLSWASSFVDSSPGTNNVTAQINDINATVVNLTITLADATLISVGQTIQFNNVGANDVTINDFSGGFLITIPPNLNSNQFILYLRDNTTQAGTWGITQLGAGTSAANASELQGFGLVALNSELNSNFPGKTIGVNYQVNLGDRASILVWTGGSGTITLPPQLPGFYVAVNNEGSAAVSITTPDAKTIDGSISFPLNPSESCYFIGVEGNWNTLGYGVESFFQTNVLPPIDLSLVNPSITLTNQQASRLVQQYSGVLANNVTVYYPAAAGQWYIWNNTTGAFNVSAQLAGPTGSAIIIPQGEKVILYSDGASIYNTPTISTSATFPDGTVGAPGINFQSQSSTGFYKISSGLVGYASAGSQGLTFGGPGPGYALGFSSGLESRYYDASNTNYVGFKAGALTANQIWTLPLTDSVGIQSLVSDGAGVLSWASGVTNVSGTANRITVINPTTTPVIDIAATYVGQTSITTLGTITTGTWNGSLIDVPHGGTGLATLTTPYGVVCAGTTAIGSLQNAGTGNANEILTSNGNAALSTWQNRSAVKADQTNPVSTTKFVTPAVQQNHPSAAKFWCQFNGTLAGTNAPTSGYNVVSVTNNGGALYTVNFITPFLTTAYHVGVTTSAATATGNAGWGNIEGQATSSCQVSTFGVNGTATPSECAKVMVHGFGLQ